MSSLFALETTKIHDDGEDEVEAHDPATCKACEEKTCPNQDKFIAAAPARSAWPDDAFVYIVSNMDVGSYELATKLQKEDPDCFPPLIWASIFSRRLEGEWFTDPGTGDPMKLPDDVRGRMDVLRKLPLSIIGYVNSQILEKANSPLSGSTPQKDSGGASGLRVIPGSTARRAKPS